MARRYLFFLAEMLSGERAGADGPLAPVDVRMHGETGGDVV